jgi:hypothetical protein
MKLSTIFTLSVALLITSSLSAEEKMKKELGICGKTLSAVLKVAPNAEPQIASAFKLEDEFCDYGRYEQNANYIVYFYDAKDKLVYDKYVFLSTEVVHETTDHKKKPGEIELKKISKGPASRVVKIPLDAKLEQIKSYKVESLEDKKISAKKSLTWTAP